MRFERITVQNLLPTASYLNIRLGADLILDEGDDPKEAMKAALELTQEFHKEQYPNLYKDGRPIFQAYTGEEEVIQEKKPVPPGMQFILDKINKCTTPEQLEKERTRADMNPEIKKVWKERYDILLYQEELKNNQQK